MNESKEKMNQYLDDLLAGDRFEMSVLANASALIKQMTEDINWVGFYILKEGKLYLGPFQGKVACNVIDVGKGVCGSSAKTGKTIVVPDVTKFPGHIACDEASKSELVVPIFVNDKLYGVLDLDSASLNRFKEKEVRLFEEAAQVVSKHLNK